MKMTHELKMLAFFILPALAAADKCPGKGGCHVRQLGSPQYTTAFLQCSNDSCQNAIFAPSPSNVCIIRYPAKDIDKSTVRIYLRDCANFDEHDGHLLDGKANVVNSNLGMKSNDTLFSDTSCETDCGAIEHMMYQLNGKTLIADNKQIRSSTNASCSQALQIYPNILNDNSECNDERTTMTINHGSSVHLENVVSTTKRPTTLQNAVLEITNGTNAVAVGSPERLSDGSYRLRIVQQHKGEIFFVQSYHSQAGSANGTIERVTAYTLQLVKLKKYLVANVFHNTTLNIKGARSTGLNLETASRFPKGRAKEPDYRFFVKYDVTASGHTANVFCSLFHRNYCLYPAVTGYLSLIPVNNADQSLKPTFVNPTDDVLRQFLNKSRPTLGTSWHVNLRFVQY